MGTSYSFGQAAEQVVATYLQSRGGKILTRRWLCKVGEIDLIADLGGELHFVEVKGRSGKNWDSGGLEAVGITKQRKLCRAAQVFLQAHPEYQSAACHFDVALVCKKPLQLQLYLEDAFGCL
ncbi:MAG: YraN family protein [Anaerolineae bacterium]|nr:YraN family protein [Gloeobacterales cyanobacterium ES-bin-313]